MSDVFEFNEAAHTYTLNGKPLSGVTTVLRVISKGDGLLQWAVNLAVKAMQDGKPAEEAKVAWKAKRDDAGTKGTDLHALVEEYVKHCLHFADGKPITVEGDAHKPIQDFIDWAQENNIRFLASEQKIYSKDLWLAGTYDLLIEKDGKKLIADVKTSKAIYPTYFYQMAAYALMLREQGVDDIAGAVVIKLNGGIETQYRYDLETDTKAFLGALAIHRANQTYAN